MVSHRPFKIFMIAFAWLLLLATFFFNGIISFDAEILKWGLFLNNTGDISDIYSVEITPSGWTFSIWGVIYVWQAAWMVYALTTICRKSDKGYLYYSPKFMHWSLYFFYSINLGCNIAWLFVWDRAIIVASFPLLVGAAIPLYICIGISIHGIYKYYPQLVRCGHSKEPWLVIFFVHNGLGVYAAWCTIASLINMAVFLTYALDIPQDISSSIALGSLAFLISFYLVLDMVLLEKFMRFLLTPYLVVIVALTGSLDKNWDVTKPNSMFTVALLATITIGALVKICIVVWKQRTQPIFVQESQAKEALPGFDEIK